MKFNRFLWENYKESKKGHELIEFFRNYSKILIDEKYQKKYKDIMDILCLEKDEGNFEPDYFTGLQEWVNEIALVASKNKIPSTIRNEADAKQVFNFIGELTYKNEDGSSSTELVFNFDSVPWLSEILYLLYPDFYFPYYFAGLYHDLNKIFNEFNIFVPDVPKKNDKRARLYHYFEISVSLFNFRIENNLSHYELPAFIYGFATQIVEKFKIPSDLATPNRAYFIGGGKKDKSVDSSGDFEYLDNANEKTVHRWNGNSETQPGDIIIMYCLSPRSYIHSIWRAVTPGYIDPFFYYYSYIYIGKSQLVSPIYINEIKEDPVLSQMPLVKGNMQGINGRIVEEKYYNRILELLEKKKQDITMLPVIKSGHQPVVELKNEKDVEETLLEPLLFKLGYVTDNWKRQLTIRMGRGEKVYPDYVIFPNEERNNESGYWIWEAKYSIKNHTQLREDFGQAKSYALRLQCKGLSLVSKEGVWLFPASSSFPTLPRLISAA